MTDIGARVLAADWLAAKTDTERKPLAKALLEPLEAEAGAGFVGWRMAELDGAMAAAAAAASDADALAALRGAARRLQPIADWEGHPLPEVLLSRDSAEPRCDAVLRRGELALLSAAGGCGKSYLSLAWARRMADGGGTACGLRMADGPAVILSYEDAPAVLAHRLARMGGCPDVLYTMPWPSALWDAEGREQGPEWDGLWAAIEAVGARLVVIDPASAALSGATNDSGSVRPFLDALRREAERLALGCLVISHDNKGSRRAAAAGEIVGADAVAGSSAWFDAARAVLYLVRAPASHKGRLAGGRLLRSLKANYGRSGWGAGLAEDEGEDGRFRGFKLAEALNDGEVEALLSDWQASVKQAAAETAKAAKARTKPAAQDPRIEDPYYDFR